MWGDMTVYVYVCVCVSSSIFQFYMKIHQKLSGHHMEFLVAIRL